jgi:hypothetical protein
VSLAELAERTGIRLRDVAVATRGWSVDGQNDARAGLKRQKKLEALLEIPEFLEPMEGRGYPSRRRRGARWDPFSRAAGSRPAPLRTLRDPLHRTDADGVQLGRPEDAGPTCQRGPDGRLHVGVDARPSEVLSL